MKILLDECVPWPIYKLLDGHECVTAQQRGWGGIQNGELLRKAVEEGFEVLVTMDSNMVHQQNIGRYAIAMIALRAKSNRLDDTRPLMKQLLALLPQSKAGKVTFIPDA